MITEALNAFPEQCVWVPEVHNAERIPEKRNVIVAGMGGSALAAGILRMRYPDLDLTVHRGYGLPAMSGDLRKESMLIASSYSGNTEETLDAFESAHAAGIPVAALGVHGKLIARAAALGIPYVTLPDTQIQPRMALGFSLKGLLALLKKENGLHEVASCATALEPRETEQKGIALAELLKERVPVIYASGENEPLAYVWKIKYNETAKIPAFANVFSELNHNEMTGFAREGKTRALSAGYAFLFLKDAHDHARIAARMEITKALYEEKGFAVIEVLLEGSGIFEKALRTAYLADWTAYALANYYGVEPEQVPLVEEFKRRIA